ncbi:MAG: nucleotidyltransferase family protein [Armatimonadetes bacterium]|nr:nucleotidyltransferase family protein [Armatimonadota bacterium]
MRWGVVVAAGGLVPDPLAGALGTPRKALAVIKGRTSLARTLDAIRDAGYDNCVTVSGEDVRDEVHFGKLVTEGDSQIENVRIATEALGPADAVLFLPADAPLLTADSLTQFVAAVEGRRDEEQVRWFAAGLCEHKQFSAKYPGFPIHPIRLRDGAFVSGALYAASPAGFLHAVNEIDRFARSRKSQLAMLWKLGPWAVICYLMHRISIADAERRVGGLMGGQAMIITGCDPCMVADIDDVATYDEIRVIANLTDSIAGEE